MYFDDPAPAFDAMHGEVRLVAVLAGAFSLGFVLIAQPLVNLAGAAAASLF